VKYAKMENNYYRKKLIQERMCTVYFIWCAKIGCAEKEIYGTSLWEWLNCRAKIRGNFSAF
jgi:hypothetical protein